MPCCGQKRANLATQLRDGATRSVDGLSSSADGGRVVPIRYLRESPIAVSGPVSGRQYVFSGRTPIQPVDVQDVPAFLRTAMFSAA